MEDAHANKHSYTVGEEIANAVTHGVGAGLSVAGLVLLIMRAVQTGDPWRVVSFTIFGVTMLLLYTSSTLYHSLAHTRARGALKVLDHSLIYVLIAGTYTPFLLVNLRGPWGWSLLGVMWGLTVAGILFKILFAGRFRGASTLLYIGMGWVGAFAAKPMLAEVPLGALQWLLAGGLAYMLGAAFYMRRSLKYHHAVWHMFVLTGTACHFTAVYGHLA